MFEQFRLTEVLVQYKQNFVSKLWGEEKYKWEAVKWFQDNWDVNAPDFAEMLNRSLDKTYNLLASANNFHACFDVVTRIGVHQAFKETFLFRIAHHGDSDLVLRK